MNHKVREKLIGDRTFYRRLFGIAVPMMIQMGITNFASMLDNIMVGQVGTEQMTGVAIAECGKCRQHVRVWTGLSAHRNDLFYSFCGCPGIRRNVERDGTDAGADESGTGVCADKSDFKLHPDLCLLYTSQWQQDITRPLEIRIRQRTCSGAVLEAVWKTSQSWETVFISTMIRRWL